MNKTTLAFTASMLLMAGCSTMGRGPAAKPPPFQCTSIHPEVCELEKQFHLLRFEQAEQNAAIDAAERRRKAAVAANAESADGYLIEYPVPATTEHPRHPVQL